jgi:hypothetical protein
VTLVSACRPRSRPKRGPEHPDRDAQFGYLNTIVAQRLSAGQPVISVDTKKKELVGELRRKSDPVKVNVHDFIGEQGRANLYGVYDLAASNAWVSVGTDHDTSRFAVATIRSWWQQMGQDRYPSARELLITADCAAPTGTACGCGRSSCNNSRTSSRCRSPSATSRRAPASGTGSSTAYSDELAREAARLPRGDHQPDRRDNL